MNKIPYVAFGNNELKKLANLGDKVLCPRCGKMHKVIFGKKVLEDGTKVESNLLAAVKCKGKLILVGVNGKDVTLHQRTN